MAETKGQGKSTTGTVDWFDDESGVGAVRPDDGTSACTIRSETLRASGIDTLTPGDRLRFRIRDESGERVATKLARLRAVERWEDEGGAVRPDDYED